jgi:hypothetical protein
MSDAPWSGGIERMLARVRDTAGSARSLAQLYAPSLRLIPLGPQAEEGAHVGATQTSIDSLQAARETADATLRQIAAQHADTVLSLHQRADGSFIQSSSLDAASGRLVRHYTHKGYSDTSTWGRAQAWGILFATQSYFAERGREAWLVDRHLTPIGPGDTRPPGRLVDACFNKRADARSQDRASRCEFIVGGYYLFEALLALDGRLDPTRV